MNKKGFSLLELIVAVAILAIIAAVLAPTMTQTQYDAKEKTDLSALENLASTVQAGTQQSNIFKNAKKMADQAVDNQIVFYFKVDEDNIVCFDYAEINMGSEILNTKNPNGKTADLEDYKTKLLDYINGIIEPIELQSKYYQLQRYKVTITFTDVDFKVESNLEVIVQSE